MRPRARRVGRRARQPETNLITAIGYDQEEDAVHYRHGFPRYFKYSHGTEL